MKKLLNKIKNIVRGWYYDFKGINIELSDTRMEICKVCEFHECLSNFCICSRCGCPTSKKTKVPEEKCLEGKW